MYLYIVLGPQTNTLHYFVNSFICHVCFAVAIELLQTIMVNMEVLLSRLIKQI